MDQLESLHELGFIHQDLKLENILIGSKNKSSPSSSQIILVDFGLASRYQSEEGNHTPFVSNVKFVGNLVYSSHNAFR